MCVGAAGALLAAGLSIAGSMVSYGAAQKAADDQNAYYMANARAAQQATVDAYTSQNIRQHQEKEAADQKVFENSVEGLKKRGTAYASAGEAGVSGLSVDALVGDVFAQEGRKQMVVDSQYVANRQNILSEMEETMHRGQARINSVQRASGPSAASYLIQGLTGAVKAFSPASTYNMSVA